MAPSGFGIVLLSGDRGGFCPRVSLFADHRGSCCSDLGGCRRFNALFKEEAGHARAQLIAPVAGSADAALVFGRLDLERTMDVMLHADPAFVLIERAMHFGVLADSTAHDAARLMAVQDQFPVLTLQAQTDALRDVERDRGCNE